VSLEAGLTDTIIEFRIMALILVQGSVEKAWSRDSGRNWFLTSVSSSMWSVSPITLTAQSLRKVTQVVSQPFITMTNIRYKSFKRRKFYLDYSFKGCHPWSARCIVSGTVVRLAQEYSGVKLFAS
jgi:hypothetical protein